MALDFPLGPVVGQQYPFTPVPGQPVFIWDGEKWVAAPAAPAETQGVVRYDTAQSLTAVQQTQARQNIYAAPFDAMAYSGMQINGGMEVSQENGAAAVSTALKYVVDGYVLDIAGAGVSAAQVADAPPGFTSSIKITVGTATPSLNPGDICRFLMRIEGYRFARLAFGTANAMPLTIGFWCKTHRPGMYSGSLRNNPAARMYVFTFTQNAADAWEYKTITIPGDTSGTWTGGNASAASLSFTMAAAASNQTSAINTWAAGIFAAATGTTNGVAATSDTFQITGVVALPGTQVPTAAQSPLILRPYDQELLTCQRYFQQAEVNMRWSAPIGTQFLTQSQSTVSKRASATITLIVTGTISPNAAAVTLTHSRLDTLSVLLTNTAAAGDCYALQRLYNVDARL